jgi:6,7-dimethyl-8-ribityllumazine synthase
MKNNKFKQLNGRNLKIAIVQARFNQEVTDSLVNGALEALKESGAQDKNIKIFKVPGSFEIPIFCQNLAKRKKFDGIVAVGAVIKGETAHFEYIAQAVADGILKVSLDYNLPITFGVITTYNIKQARERAGNNKSNKGYEAAMALVELVGELKGINVNI